MQNFQDEIAGICAAVLGWIFVSLPRVVRRQTTWVMVLANIGLAAVVGLATWSLLAYLTPKMPKNLVGAICAIVGGQCDYWYNRYTAGLQRAADRAEHQMFDRDGDESRPE